MQWGVMLTPCTACCIVIIISPFNKNIPDVLSMSPSCCLFVHSYYFVFMTIILVTTKSNGPVSWGQSSGLWLMLRGWSPRKSSYQSLDTSHLSHARGGMGRIFIGWIPHFLFSICQKKTRVASCQKKDQVGGKGAQLTSIDFGFYTVSSYVSAQT